MLFFSAKHADDGLWSSSLVLQLPFCWIVLSAAKKTALECLQGDVWPPPRCFWENDDGEVRRVPLSWLRMSSSFPTYLVKVGSTSRI